KDIDLTKASGSSDNSPKSNWDVASTARLPVWLCPADPQRGESWEFGWTNYHVNYGTWVFANGWDGVFAPNFDPGSFRKSPCFLRVTDIVDGTSSTAAIAEVCNAVGDKQTSTPANPRLDCFEYTTTITNKNAQQVQATLLGLNWQTAGYAGSPGW